MASSRQSHNIAWNQLGAGAILAVAQVSTLGQPCETVKTTMAANREDNLRGAIRRVWGRGGFTAFYQGLIPWAWLEAATKGAILMISSGETERAVLRLAPTQKTLAGATGGVVGGLAQTYLVMGLTTTMKTVEMTRSKAGEGGKKPPSTLSVCRDIYRREGIKGLNKGANAVALRQMTGWASRMGLTRFNEGIIKSVTGKDPNDRLNPGEKIIASITGGALSCWNQPFEVIRVEMQSAIPSALRANGRRPGTLETAKYIVNNNGWQGLFRGITPRICLAASVTTFMVAGGDLVKERLK